MGLSQVHASTVLLLFTFIWVSVARAQCSPQCVGGLCEENRCECFEPQRNFAGRQCDPCPGIYGVAQTPCGGGRAGECRASSDGAFCDGGGCPDGWHGAACDMSSSNPNSTVYTVYPSQQSDDATFTFGRPNDLSAIGDENLLNRNYTSTAYFTNPDVAEVFPLSRIEIQVPISVNDGNPFRVVITNGHSAGDVSMPLVSSLLPSNMRLVDNTVFLLQLLDLDNVPLQSLRRGSSSIRVQIFTPVRVVAVMTDLYTFDPTHLVWEDAQVRPMSTSIDGRTAVFETNLAMGVFGVLQRQLDADEDVCPSIERGLVEVCAVGTYCFVTTDDFDGDTDVFERCSCPPGFTWTVRSPKCTRTIFELEDDGRANKVWAGSRIVVTILWFLALVVAVASVVVHAPKLKISLRSSSSNKQSNQRRARDIVIVCVVSIVACVSRLVWLLIDPYAFNDRLGMSNPYIFDAVIRGIVFPCLLVNFTLIMCNWSRSYMSMLEVRPKHAELLEWVWAPTFGMFAVSISGDVLFGINSSYEIALAATVLRLLATIYFVVVVVTVLVIGVEVLLSIGRKALRHSKKLRRSFLRVFALLIVASLSILTLLALYGIRAARSLSRSSETKLALAMRVNSFMATFWLTELTLVLSITSILAFLYFVASNAQPERRSNLTTSQGRQAESEDSDEAHRRRCSAARQNDEVDTATLDNLGGYAVSSGSPRGLANYYIGDTEAPPCMGDEDEGFDEDEDV